MTEVSSPKYSLGQIIPVGGKLDGIIVDANPLTNIEFSFTVGDNSSSSSSTSFGGYLYKVEYGNATVSLNEDQIDRLIMLRQGSIQKQVDQLEHI